ncbi:MAG: adenylate/guanylate cyclase domain-containing protein [Gammaproteobacteria bacterium]|nr:adenylate/guanylate cyclase domain-containing protein [Gammaproteobacteria bacterium]MDH3984645.1 adenylate/guanylate cyclase domain-containing protein [Gammaproteobacteria bacterium]
MAEIAYHKPLTGHDEFDSLIADFSDESDPEKAEEVRQRIWDKFGTKGAVFISDMASFSSTSRKVGVCHFLKMIHRTRQIVAPVIEANRGVLLKCDADNCYAFFKSADDAIRASFDVNGALFQANDRFDLGEQVNLSVGIDFGRVLLIGDIEFFGDPVNTASKLGEDLATRNEVLVTHRAIENSNFEIPELAERMVARISEIEIQYVRLPMTENSPGR